LFRLNGFFVYRDMDHDDERKGALADLEAGPDRYDSRNHVPDHRPATGPLRDVLGQGRRGSAD